MRILAVAVFLVVVVAGGLSALVAPSVAGAAVAVGAAEIVQPGTSIPLRAGGSATPYGVLLPQGASCPGDTAHGNYHVFSYLVPNGVAPSAVNFGGILPSRGFGYIANGEYYGAINTAENTGLIPGLPADFTWSRLTPQELFTKGEGSALWDGGIVCATARGQVTDAWNTEFLFTASATDPGGFTWSVVGQDPPSSSSGGQFPWFAVVLVVAAVVLGGSAVGMSRRRATGRRHADG